MTQTIDQIIDTLDYRIDIPERRHGSLVYGRHWSVSGASGHYVRHRGHWLLCHERPDIGWGTARCAARHDDVVTLADVRAEMDAVIDEARAIRRGA